MIRLLIDKLFKKKVNYDLDASIWIQISMLKKNHFNLKN